MGVRPNWRTDHDSQNHRAMPRSRDGLARLCDHACLDQYPRSSGAMQECPRPIVMI
jgi:hypothetical protein